MTKIKNWIKTHKAESILIACSTITFIAGVVTGFNIGDIIATNRGNKKLEDFVIFDKIKLTNGDILTADATRDLYAYSLSALEYAIINKKFTNDEYSIIANDAVKKTSITSLSL